jgi:phospholipase/lecithinase/hemolysin
MNYKNLYVLGDSLSDTGALLGSLSGLADRKLSLPAPFFQGRSFSDGRLAVEHVAAKLQLPLQSGWSCRAIARKSEQIGNNYAVANARASMGTLGIYEFFFNQFQLKNQLAALMNHHSIGEDDLFIIMIGSNDLLGVVGGEPGIKLKEAVHEIGEVLTILAKNKVKHIIVSDAPDIGLIPLFINTPSQTLATQLTICFNRDLKVKIDDFSEAYPTVQLKQFDMVGVFADIIYLLSNKQYDTTHACLSDIADHLNVAGLLDILLKGQLGDVIYTSGCSKEKICAYTFFDYVHPTQEVHRRVGEHLYDLIRTKEYVETAI